MATMDDEDAWEALAVPRGVEPSDIIYFLRKRLSEAERADLAAEGYQTDPKTYYYAADNNGLTVGWADVRAAQAVQVVKGGEIVTMTIVQAMARAIKSGIGFVLRVPSGEEYVFELRPTRLGRKH